MSKEVEMQALREEEEGGQGEAQHDGAVYTPSPPKRRGGIRCAALVLFLLLVVSAAVLGVYVLFLSDGAPLGTGKEGPRDCRDDGFLGIDVNDGDGKDSYIKYKIVQKSEDDLFTFQQARDVCSGMDAQLWQVTGGEAEWSALSSLARQAGQSSLWLDAVIVERCEGGAEAVCRTADDVENGLGLQVKWPSQSGHLTSNYTRYVGGSADDCVAVEERQRHLLWKSVDCQSEYFAPCVKRNCIRPQE